MPSLAVKEISASQLAPAAFHLAGHAVAAQLLGYAPHHLALDVDEEAVGEVVHPSPLKGIRLAINQTDQARLRAEKAIIISLAGPVAQRRCRPGAWKDWYGEADMEVAAKLAIDTNGSDEIATAFVTWLTLRAKALVEENWDVIEAVATALLDEGELSSDQVAAIISQAQSGRVGTRRQRAG